MRALQRLRVSALMFVNNIDRRRAGYDRVLRAIHRRGFPRALDSALFFGAE
jgi:hypothetical protein